MNLAVTLTGYYRPRHTRSGHRNPKTRVGGTRRWRRARRPPSGLYLAPHQRLKHAESRNLASGRTRWPNRDPVGIIGGPNICVYAMNHPVSFVDPLGLIVDFRSRLPLCDYSRLGDCRIAEISRFIVDARMVRVADVGVSVDTVSRSLLLDFQFMEGTPELDAYRRFARLTRSFDFFMYLTLAYRYNPVEFTTTAMYTEMLNAMGSVIADQMANLVTHIRDREPIVTLSLEYKCTTCKCKQFLFWRHGWDWEDDNRPRTFPCREPSYGYENAYYRSDLFSQPALGNIFRRCLYKLLKEKPCEN